MSIRLLLHSSTRFVAPARWLFSSQANSKMVNNANERRASLVKCSNIDCQPILKNEIASKAFGELLGKVVKLSRDCSTFTYSQSKLLWYRYIRKYRIGGKLGLEFKERITEFLGQVYRLQLAWYRWGWHKKCFASCQEVWGSDCNRQNVVKDSWHGTHTGKTESKTLVVVADWC